MSRKAKWTKRERSSDPLILEEYQPGDQVVLLADLNGIPAGTIGKVVRGVTSEYYPVLFEGTAYPRGMYSNEIGPNSQSLEG